MTTDRDSDEVDELGWLRALRQNLPGTSDDGGLRERKKRHTRQQISNTATAMFLKHGFDNVRITEIAAACGVSEKTIYNYFPTKESLVLDIEDELVASLERELGPDSSHGSPVDAMVSIIERQVHRIVDVAETNGFSDMAMVRSFIRLVESTPSLRAAHFEMTERLGEVATHLMASRAEVDPQSPEASIAGDTLLSIWRLAYKSFLVHADPGVSPQEFERQVVSDVRRGARLLDTGLWSYAMLVQGRNTREQLRIAATKALDARSKVLKTILDSKNVWREAAGHAYPNETSQQRRQRARAALSDSKHDILEVKNSVEQAKREILSMRDDLRQQAKSAAVVKRSKRNR